MVSSKELTTNDMIAILKAMRDDQGVTKRFDIRVRQVAEKNGRKWGEQHIQNVVRRMVEDWVSALNDKIFKLMSDDMDGNSDLQKVIK